MLDMYMYMYILRTSPPTPQLHMYNIYMPPISQNVNSQFRSISQQLSIGSRLSFLTFVSPAQPLKILVKAIDIVHVH